MGNEHSNSESQRKALGLDKQSFMVSFKRVNFGFTVRNLPSLRETFKKLGALRAIKIAKAKLKAWKEGELDFSLLVNSWQDQSSYIKEFIHKDNKHITVSWFEQTFQKTQFYANISKNLASANRAIVIPKTELVLNDDNSNDDTLVKSKPVPKRRRDYIIPKEIPDKEATEIQLLKERLEADGYRVEVFSIAFEHVLEAITKRAKIGKVDIAHELRTNPKFRFICRREVALSLNASEAFSAQSQYSQASLRKDISKTGTRKVSENADEFARKMYDAVNKIKAQNNLSSYREVVKALNENKVPTQRGGAWHVATLQDLTKRWKELGLTPTPKPK
ncbi:hypothetical protein [Spirosoma sp. KNUC1025]|uniref:hypothetical protein n=1 Tax=Spirosoma sp. KNUC1025 TaxID=2894082 RepID=UPI00386733D1|nr:hypothetical protein LN737_01235 [Spirosoma sp. KNUC1025]